MASPLEGIRRQRHSPSAIRLLLMSLRAVMLAVDGLSDAGAVWQKNPLISVEAESQTTSIRTAFS
jgi:hypothetical protein